jgi:hypothetical protein
VLTTIFIAGITGKVLRKPIPRDRLCSWSVANAQILQGAETSFSPCQKRVQANTVLSIATYPARNLISFNILIGSGGLMRTDNLVVLMKINAKKVERLLILRKNFHY